ncbi:MACPF domain-containing protein At4g24290, partial [Linum perenne]
EEDRKQENPNHPKKLHHSTKRSIIDFDRQAKRAAEAAVQAIGQGFDLTVDLRLKYCKPHQLIIIDDQNSLHRLSVPVPVGFSVAAVPKSIRCDKGDRTRFSSDLLSFQQMSEQFNQDLAISGKIPSGAFNAAFEFTGVWQKDAASTKALAADGVFITLYSIALQKSQVVLNDHIKKAVPSSWDPAALARFIEKYGTHVIVGVKMGGKDVVYAKQQHGSPLQPVDMQKKLKGLADKIFTDGTGQTGLKQDRKVLNDTKFIHKRIGGLDKTLPHSEWCHTVQFEPEVISMSFVPITSLLSGIDGSGFLTHAINLYIRYKPPIEELHQFLEFQLPKHWAPVFGDLALGPDRKHQGNASLQFSFMGPRLYVNTMPVYVDNKPVTGLRLYLEGKRSNCLAIHLQHLSSSPKTFQLETKPNTKLSSASSESDRRYFEKVQWKSFSHVCTAPVESEDDLSIVTGAHFEVGESGLKNVLFLKLHFSRVIGASGARKVEWDGSPASNQKSGIISALISTRFSSAQKAAAASAPKPGEVQLNSAVYPGGPPVSSQVGKLLKYVDTTEMTRGPQDTPGYWVVSGAKLNVERGKISVRVKYSLLTLVSPDEEDEVS